MIDFHTHLLPNIDDGSRNLEETLEILDKQEAASIKQIIATPHFYPDQKLETFVEKRREAYLSIEEDIARRQMEVRLGAEVLLSVDTYQLEDLEALCVEGTHYMLVELPYSHWSDWVYTSIEKLIVAKGLIPILAHVERYDTVYENPNVLLPFLEMGCLLQANAISLHPESSRRKLTLGLAKHGFIHLLGSDVHRSGGLHSVDIGYQTLREKVGSDYVDYMLEIGRTILKDGRVEPKGYKPFKKLFGKWY